MPQVRGRGSPLHLDTGLHAALKVHLSSFLAVAERLGLRREADTILLAVASGYSLIRSEDIVLHATSAPTTAPTAALITGNICISLPAAHPAGKPEHARVAVHADATGQTNIATQSGHVVCGSDPKEASGGRQRQIEDRVSVQGSKFPHLRVALTASADALGMQQPFSCLAAILTLARNVSGSQNLAWEVAGIMDPSALAVLQALWKAAQAKDKMQEAGTSAGERQAVPTNNAGWWHRSTGHFCNVLWQLIKAAACRLDADDGCLRSAIPGCSSSPESHSDITVLQVQAHSHTADLKVPQQLQAQQMLGSPPAQEPAQVVAAPTFLLDMLGTCASEVGYEREWQALVRSLNSDPGLLVHDASSSKVRVGS